MMTSQQSGSPIGGEGNSQTTHGSIVVESISITNVWRYHSLAVSHQADISSGDTTVLHGAVKLILSRVVSYQGVGEVKLQKAEITLNDCLACSGCITSAESVLITQQSQHELYKVLENNRTLAEVSMSKKHI